MRSRLVLLAALLVALVLAAPARANFAVSWGQNNHDQLCAATKSQGGSTVPLLTLVPHPVQPVTGGQWLGVLVEDGEVWTCGGNEQGQAANGAKAAFKATPSAIPGLTGVSSIAGGGEHMAALLTNGHVKVWGSNFAGQECDGREGKKLPVTSPEELRYADNTPVTGIVQVVIGGADTYILRNDGRVFGCGEDHKVQLGDGTTVNKTRLVPVAGLEHITALSANGAAAVGEHLLALTEAGTLLCVGLNDYGQCGNGTTVNASHPVPAGKGLTGVVRFSAGPDHDLAVTSSGTVYSWGQDTYGQLGYAASTVCGSGKAKTVCSLLPRQVAGFTAGGLVTAGTHFSLVTQGGRLFSFGQNRYETLGDGTTTDRQTPEQVDGGLEGVSAIAGGYFNAAAVTTTHVLPEISVVPGVGFLTLDWISTNTHEPWHVRIRPVTVPVVPFGKAVTLVPGARSYSFTGLTSGRAYELSVDSKGVRAKIATGVAG